MAEINTQNQEVRQLKGLHLYHSGFSTCSQSVRMALGEKKLSWSSHTLDLKSNEHLSPEYLSINPYGVVPTLVHDGRVITDTLDVLSYLDTFSSSLALTDGGEIAQVWVKRWLAFKPKSKVLSFEFLFREAGRRSPEHLNQYLTRHPNPNFVQFQREFNSHDGLPKEKVRLAVYTAHQDMHDLNQQLTSYDFIAGHALGLPDILWMPKIHRLQWTLFPFELYPAVQSWYKRMLVRASFQRAVGDYEPTDVRHFLNHYSLKRKKQGTGITAIPVSEEILACVTTFIPSRHGLPCGCG